MPRRLIKRKTRCMIKRKYDRSGYLSEVINPCGKKKSVDIIEPANRSGFAARLSDGKKPFAYGKNAEVLMTRLAKKGYKRVRFLG